MVQSHKNNYFKHFIPPSFNILLSMYSYVLLFHVSEHSFSLPFFLFLWPHNMEAFVSHFTPILPLSPHITFHFIRVHVSSNHVIISQPLPPSILTGSFVVSRPLAVRSRVNLADIAFCSWHKVAHILFFVKHFDDMPGSLCQPPCSATPIHPPPSHLTKLVLKSPKTHFSSQDCWMPSWLPASCSVLLLDFFKLYHPPPVLSYNIQLFIS